MDRRKFIKSVAAAGVVVAVPLSVPKKIYSVQGGVITPDSYPLPIWPSAKQWFGDKYPTPLSLKPPGMLYKALWIKNG